MRSPRPRSEGPRRWANRPRRCEPGKPSRAGSRGPHVATSEPGKRGGGSFGTAANQGRSVTLVRRCWPLTRPGGGRSTAIEMTLRAFPMAYQLSWRASAWRRLAGSALRGGSLALSGCGGAATRGAQRVPVAVARVEQRTVPYEIEATGTVEPVQSAAVTAQVGGLVKRVTFREGDTVAEGQALIQIDPRPY